MGETSGPAGPFRGHFRVAREVEAEEENGYREETEKGAFGGI